MPKYGPCPTGYVRNYKTGHCRKPCKKNQRRSARTGRCIMRSGSGRRRNVSNLVAVAKYAKRAKISIQQAWANVKAARNAKGEMWASGKSVSGFIPKKVAVASTTAAKTDTVSALRAAAAAFKPADVVAQERHPYLQIGAFTGWQYQ